MTWPAPFQVLSGRLRPVAGDQPAFRAAPAAAARIAGWRHLAAEPFVLAVDSETPAAWPARLCLARWPAGATADGEPGPYGAVVFARTAARRVLVCRHPEAPDRLELLAEVALRRTLAVRDGERLHLAIHEPASWHALPPWGYHHMCG